MLSGTEGRCERLANRTPRMTETGQGARLVPNASWMISRSSERNLVVDSARCKCVRAAILSLEDPSATASTQKRSNRAEHCAITTSDTGAQMEEDEAPVPDAFALHETTTLVEHGRTGQDASASQQDRNAGTMHRGSFEEPSAITLIPSMSTAEPHTTSSPDIASSQAARDPVPSNPGVEPEPGRDIVNLFASDIRILCGTRFRGMTYDDLMSLRSRLEHLHGLFRAELEQANGSEARTRINLDLLRLQGALVRNGDARNKEFRRLRALNENPGWDAGPSPNGNDRTSRDGILNGSSPSNSSPNALASKTSSSSLEASSSHNASTGIHNLNERPANRPVPGTPTQNSNALRTPSQRAPMPDDSPDTATPRKLLQTDHLATDSSPPQDTMSTAREQQT